MDTGTQNRQHIQELFKPINLSLKKFLFFITEKDGRTRQIVNGVVTSIANPAPLPQAPDGNQEISIGWERSPIYRGNIRNFGLELGYVGDGRKILQNDFYNYTIDRELYLLVKRLTYEWNDTTFKEYYKQLYKGQFDFSTASDDHGEYRFNIGIMEGGLQRLLKANENTVYELPFDIESKNVYMDGMYITGKFKWFVAPYPSLTDGYPSLGQLSNDNPIPGLAIFDVQILEQSFDPNADTLEYFAEATQNIAGVHLTGQIVDLNSNGSAGPLAVRLYVFNRKTNTLRLSINLTPDDPYPEHYTLVIDETLDLLEGDRIFLKSASAFEGEGFLMLDAKSKPVASTIRGFTLYDVGKKLTEKITGNADDFESSLLADLVTDFGSEIILTSGDGVRGITNAALKTSWKDFYKFVDVMLMTQMTITDKIRIYNRITAYQPTTVKPAIPLGTVKNLKVTPAIDEMFTSIKVGHAEQQVDDTNGKFDPLGYMVFTTPVKTITDKQLDLQSPYKASPYEIEQTRANYEGKLTTDKETDNDVFALAVQKTYADTFETTAVFDPTGSIFAPGEYLIAIVAAEPLILPGMKIRVTNALDPANNRDYTVKSGTGWFFGQLITVNEAIVAESGGVITIEILEGQIYTLDRAIELDQLADPDADEVVKGSVFNIRLSPKRILLRHMPWITAALYGYAGELVFSSANRNKEMIAGGIVEKANVPLGDTSSAMFISKYLEFDTISPVDMVETLGTDPNPAFSFEWEGVIYEGFFIRGGIALNDLEEQTFKLLTCPGVNLLNLIS